MDTESCSAAHGNAVQIGDKGFGVGSNQMIKLILEREVGFCELITILASSDLFSKNADVPTSAKSLWTCTSNHDDICQL